MITMVVAATFRLPIVDVDGKGQAFLERTNSWPTHQP